MSVHCLSETVVSCTYWSKNCHIISSWLSYGLLYISFHLCFDAVWCV